MRIANYDNRLVVVVDGLAVDVERASDGRFGADVQAVYEHWADFRDWAAGAELPSGVPIDPARLGPPAPRPRQVFAVGLNYLEHAAEGGFAVPTTPSIFTKFPSCLTGPVGEVWLPDGNVDWEAELVAVIASEARGVARADAWAHIAGVTLGQDISERITQHQPPVPQFSMGKSFAGFGPMGPHLLTPDEFPDPDDIELVTRVNGVVMQQARTSDMVFDVGAIVQFISSIAMLYAGDVIFTGTPPGVGKGRVPPRYLAAGDVLESEAELIGSMRLTMRHTQCAV